VGNYKIIVGNIMNRTIPYGYCQCGCGQKTSIARQTDSRRKHKKGKPIKFIHGHHARLQPNGENAHRWKGGVYKNQDRRTLIYNPDHPRTAENNSYVFQSILIAEKALGKFLPPKSEIHHFDNNPSNDDPSNLVICENRRYHFLLHRRKRAFIACGNANWRKCGICKKHDNPENLYISNSCGHVYHPECQKKYIRNLEKRKKLDSHKT
jgi:hypothetical protein